MTTTATTNQATSSRPLSTDELGYANKEALKQKLKSLPTTPGVYQMLGKHKEVLYVGKAKSLKNRVSSYFVKTHEHPKTAALVARIYDVTWLVVRGEVEALLLEQTLIKEYRPPYNVMLRDDKSYLYIYLSSDKFPRLALGRGKGNHKDGRFFGPYPSATGAKELMVLLQKLFFLRTCSNDEFAKRKRPCLEYQIKRCKAPCVQMITQAEYQEDVAQALDFLKGERHAVHASLVQKMQAAAEALDFEQAAVLRDRLAMLSSLTANQAVYTKEGDADVMALASQAGVVCVYVLMVRGGQVLGGKSYFLDNVMTFEASEPESQWLAEFILSFYRDVSEDIPAQIITSHVPADADTITRVLSQQQPTTIKPMVRGHRKEWLEIAKLNASNALMTQLSDYHELRMRFLALKEVLQTVSDRAIDRIECFDISHTMGEAAVASCVVFDQGGARRREYRHYAIHDITAGDDYAAMRQVLTRRYSKHPLPDMLLIDGGKGQLGVAKDVLVALDKLEETLLVSVAKGEGRKAGLEVLHFICHDPIDLAPDHKALHLIMHIRDEAHRFAITHHRKKRDKARGASVLEVIPGLGAKRRRDLLTYFGGIGQLLSASEEDIAKVNGIGKVLAKTIYKALHG